MFVLLATTATVFKSVSLAWSVGTVVIGVGVSMWVATKVSAVKLSALKEEVEKHEHQIDDLRTNLSTTEKEISNSLKNIEIQLTELATTVRLYMERNP